MANRAFTMVMTSFSADSLALGAHSGDESLPLEWMSALNKEQQISQMLKQLR